MLKHFFVFVSFAVFIGPFCRAGQFKYICTVEGNVCTRSDGGQGICRWVHHPSHWVCAYPQPGEIGRYPWEWDNSFPGLTN